MTRLAEDLRRWQVLDGALILKVDIQSDAVFVSTDDGDEYRIRSFKPKQEITS